MNVMKHNNKEYQPYYLGWGITVEQAVVELIKESIKKKQLLYCKFNIYYLFSDEVSLDSAYKEIVGKSYNEFKESEKKKYEVILKQNAEYEKKVPHYIQHYLDKGHKIIDETYWSEYDKIVEPCVRGMYKGSDIDQALELIQMLNDNDEIADVVKKLKLQDHSGFSMSVVRTIVRDFCNRGMIFFEATV